MRALPAELRTAIFSPHPCGEGPGVAPKKAMRVTSLCAERRRPILNHPHPHPPCKGEEAETPRLMLGRARP